LTDTYCTSNNTVFYFVFFFFQAEDGIRDSSVTGVQTCALPISDLLARGDIILSSGWQGDIVGKAGAQSIVVPVTKYKDGSSITGPVVTRFAVPAAGTKTLTLPSHFALASNDSTRSTLTKRTSEEGAAIPIASE